MLSIILPARNEAAALAELLPALRAAQPGAEIIVSDDGPGIPAEERAMALRRFGRLKRNAAPGHGLGLPLVDAIARLHGGLMRLEDAAPGLRVRVWLPLL